MNAKPASKPAPLGRGLSALFGDTDSSYGAQVAAAAPRSTRNQDPTHTIPIEWIQPGAYQPRRHFDEEAIQDLAKSIKERGLILPIMVRPLEGEKDNYEIIAGERRWRAAQLAGLHEVPVLIRHFSDREAMEIGLIENVQRQDLSPLEEAEGYRRLLEEFHHTQEGLAKVVGKSRPHITNLLRLLTLPEPVKEMITNGELTMGHARAIITAKNPEELAKEIVKKGLSVRQAEALAKKASDGKFAKKTRSVKNVDPDVLALEQSLEKVLGLKVRLHADGAAGSLTVFYEDLDQLDAVIQKLQA